MAPPNTARAHSPKTAILAGATGLAGGQCLRLLLDCSAYAQVLALLRRPLPLEHPKLRQLTVSFEDLPTLPEFAGADVFCALGSTIKKAGSQDAFRKVDHDYPLALAQAAAKSGARQFLLITSVGADAHSSTFYLRVKGELEDVLKLLPFHAVHIFRPSFLVGERTESRPGERVGIALARGLEFLLVAALRKYRPMPVAKLAAAMLAAARLAQPGAHIYEYDQMISLAQS